MYWHTASHRILRCSLPSQAGSRLATEDCRPPRTEAAGIRRDLVERVRREIAQGTYDTPQRWEAALDRLLDQLS